MDPSDPAYDYSSSAFNTLLDELHNALLDCRSLGYPSTRDQIVNELPPEIGRGVRREPDTNGDVGAILDASRDYPGGVDAFVAIVASLDGESIPFLRVRASLDALHELAKAPQGKPEARPENSGRRTAFASWAALALAICVVAIVSAVVWSRLHQKANVARHVILKPGPPKIVGRYLLGEESGASSADWETFVLEKWKGRDISTLTGCTDGTTGDTCYDTVGPIDTHGKMGLLTVEVAVPPQDELGEVCSLSLTSDNTERVSVPITTGAPNDSDRKSYRLTWNMTESNIPYYVFVVFKRSGQ